MDGRKILNSLLILVYSVLGYVLINYQQGDAKYAAGNGLPSAMVKNISIEPKKYNLGQKKKLLSTIPSPSPELLGGLEIKTISREASSFGEEYFRLRDFCDSVGLVKADEIISQEELSQNAGVIFEELNEYYGVRRIMPHIQWKLDEENEIFDGIYRPGFRIVTIFKQQDSLNALLTLTHELSHSWIMDDSLNNISTTEAVIRLADKFGEKYLSDPSDKESGRDACLYGMAAYTILDFEWQGIYSYLAGYKYATSSSEYYLDVLNYSLLPGLMVRYAALSDNVTNPVIETNRRYDITLSATKQMLTEQLSKDKTPLLFPLY